MAEIIGGNVRREAGGLVWYEPVEPLGGIGRLVMTTRLGGISKSPYTGLNLGAHVGDVPERVRQNRQAMMAALGRNLLSPVVGEQVHGSHVRAVGELHAGTRWETAERALAHTDALVTATRYLPLVTLVADCVPVALVDPARQAAAVIHAGWRGVTGEIVEHAVAAMKETWETYERELVAWIGPAIGPCCYEVGPEVAGQFPMDVRPGEGDRAFLNLRAAVQRRLSALGLLEENIGGMDVCTSCRSDLFFSHRKATQSGEPATGRQALILWLEKSWS